MSELKRRVAGWLAPEGSPEREYFTTSLLGGDLKAAEARLKSEGCRVLLPGEKPEWRDGAWHIHSA